MSRMTAEEYRAATSSVVAEHLRHTMEEFIRALGRSEEHRRRGMAIAMAINSCSRSFREHGDIERYRLEVTPSLVQLGQFVDESIRGLR